MNNIIIIIMWESPESVNIDKCNMVASFPALPSALIHVLKKIGESVTVVDGRFPDLFLLNHHTWGRSSNMIA